jgi:arylsulfatase A-like enzyme
MPPSILLVIIDCLRADLLSRPRAAWPAASRLAGEGVAFATAYSTCPTTTPAVAAMFTGRYPSAHGVRALRGSALSETLPTVAEELRRSGYRTWCSVTGPLLDSIGLFRGFDEAEYRDPPERSLHRGFGEKLVERLREYAGGGSPFFGVVHVWDLHTPRRYPPHLDERRYGRTTYERALAGVDPWLERVRDATGADTMLVLTGDHGENVTLEPRSLRQQELAWAVAKRVPLAEWGPRIAESGVRSRSKLLLRVAPRYFWNHNQTLLEPLVRVPFVFAGPGLAPGVRTTPVSHVDLAPTFLRLAGLPDPLAGWQGVSLAESLRGGGEPPKRPVAMEIGVTPGIATVAQQAIRDGSYKLIASLDEPSIPEALYDLVADPRERRNLAEQRPEVVARLRGELRRVLAEKGEPAAISEEDDAIISARLEELGYL